MILREEILRIKEVIDNSNRQESFKVFESPNKGGWLDEEQKKHLLELVESKERFIINGDFYVGYGFKDVGGLTEVRGDVIVTDSKFKSLGSLKEIRGSLIFYTDSEFEDLGDLKFVGGNCDFFRLKKLTSLKNLQYIGGWIRTYGSGIRSLGKLKYVGEDADFSHTPLRDIGDLEYVGGVLNLYRTVISTGRVPTEVWEHIYSDIQYKGLLGI